MTSTITTGKQKTASASIETEHGSSPGRKSPILHTHSILTEPLLARSVELDTQPDAEVYSELSSLNESKYDEMSVADGKERDVVRQPTSPPLVRLHNLSSDAVKYAPDRENKTPMNLTPAVYMRRTALEERVLQTDDFNAITNDGSYALRDKMTAFATESASGDGGRTDVEVSLPSQIMHKNKKRDDLEQHRKMLSKEEIKSDYLKTRQQQKRQRDRLEKKTEIIRKEQKDKNTRNKKIKLNQQALAMAETYRRTRRLPPDHVISKREAARAVTPISFIDKALCAENSEWKAWENRFQRKRKADEANSSRKRVCPTPENSVSTRFPLTAVSRFSTPIGAGQLVPSEMFCSRSSEVTPKAREVSSDCCESSDDELTSFEKFVDNIEMNEAATVLAKGKGFPILKTVEHVVGQYSNIVEGASNRNLVVLDYTYYNFYKLERLWEKSLFQPWTWDVVRTGKWFPQTLVLGDVRFLIGEPVTYRFPASIMYSMRCFFHRTFRGSKPVEMSVGLETGRELVKRLTANLAIHSDEAYIIERELPELALVFEIGDSAVAGTFFYQDKKRKLKHHVSKFLAMSRFKLGRHFDSSEADRLQLVSLYGSLSTDETIRDMTIVEFAKIEVDVHRYVAMMHHTKPEARFSYTEYRKRVALAEATPPAARLVGIHLNPGPAASKLLSGAILFSGRSFMLANAPHLHNKLRESAGFRLPSVLLNWDKQRPSQKLYGLGSGSYRPIAYCGNGHNEQSAVMARVVSATVEPDKSEMDMFLKFCKKMLKLMFKKDCMNIESLTFAAYLEGSGASPAMKKKLSKTWEQLKAAGIDENSELTESQLHAWGMREGFVKVENLTLQTPNGIADKAARLIQGAKPEFICLVGPFIASLQNRFKKRWGVKKPICFTSGVRADRLAQKIVDKFLAGWKVGENDMEKYDASIHKKLCAFETYMCKFFGAKRAVLQLLRKNENKKGYTSKGIYYFTDGTRASGDPYTSLFNSFWNAMTHSYSYYKERANGRLPGLWIFDHLEMLVQGDDNVFAHDGDMIDFATTIKKLGFISVVSYRNHFWDVEFCSCILMPTSTGHSFVPKPGRLMSKVGYFVSPPQNISQESLVKGTAMGLFTQCNACPPLKAYLARLLELTQGVEAARIKLPEWKMTSIVADSTPATMAMLYYRYGWTHSMQMQFVDLLQQKKLGDDLDTPLVRLFYDKDTSGVPEYPTTSERDEAEMYAKRNHNKNYKEKQPQPGRILATENSVAGLVQPLFLEKQLKDTQKTPSGDTSAGEPQNSLDLSQQSPYQKLPCATNNMNTIYPNTNKQLQPVENAATRKRAIYANRDFNSPRKGQGYLSPHVSVSVSDYADVVLPQDPKTSMHGAWLRDLTCEGVEPNPGPCEGSQDWLHNMEFKYHGNYGGPNYSGGKYGKEANFKAKPIDDLDAEFKKHDKHYSRGKYKQGDDELISGLWKKTNFSNAHKSLPAIAAFQAKRALGLSKDGRRHSSNHNQEMHALNGNNPPKGKRGPMQKLKKEIAAVKHTEKAKEKPRQKRPAASKNSGSHGSRDAVMGSGSVPKPKQSRVLSYKKQGAKCVRVSGSNLYASLTTDASGAVAGQTCYAAEIDLFKTGSELTSYAGMFSQYTINHLSIEYVPAVGTATAGTLVGAMSVDPDDSFATGSFDSARTLLTREGARSFQVHQRTSILRPKTNNVFYCPGSSHTTPPDSRFEIPGELIILTLAGCAASTVYGTLVLHYDIEFMHEAVIATPSLSQAAIVEGCNFTYSTNGADRDLVRTAMEGGPSGSITGTWTGDPLNNWSRDDTVLFNSKPYMLYRPGRYLVFLEKTSVTPMTALQIDNAVEVNDPVAGTWTTIHGTTHLGASWTPIFTNASNVTLSASSGYSYSVGSLYVHSQSFWDHPSTGERVNGCVVRWRPITSAAAFVYDVIKAFIMQTNVNRWGSYNPPTQVGDLVPTDALHRRIAKLESLLEHKEDEPESDTDIIETNPLTQSVHLKRSDFDKLIGATR